MREPFLYQYDYHCFLFIPLHFRPLTVLEEEGSRCANSFRDRPGGCQNRDAIGYAGPLWDGRYGQPAPGTGEKSSHES